MPEKKFSKERLEKSKFWFLEPKIESGIGYALKRLDEKDMTGFILATATIDSAIEHHIMNNCARAENEDIRIKCVTDAHNIKIRALNRLGEALVDKCGGILEYIEEE